MKTRQLITPPVVVLMAFCLVAPAWAQPKLPAQQSEKEFQSLMPVNSR